MSGLLVLVIVLWTCGSWRHMSSTGAEPIGQLLRKAMQSPLVQYNFILQNQEGIATDGERVESGSEVNFNQVNEVTTLDDIDRDEEEEDEEDGVEGRKVGGGGRGGGRGGGGGNVGGGGRGGGGGAGGEGGGGGRGGGGKWAAGGGSIDYSPTEEDATQNPSTIPPTSTSTTSTTTPKPRPTTQRPKTTTVTAKKSGPGDVNLSCNFGVYPDTNTCEWVIGDDSALTWRTGTGQTSNWLGGPTNDFSSDDTSGGYAFVETSQIPLQKGRILYLGAMLKSPLLRSTGPEGSCIHFAYVMDGLSPAELRVLLQTEPPKGTSNPNTNDSDVVWQAEYHTQGSWVATQFLYTSEAPHKIMFEGIPVDVSDPSRLYRGFIAVDNIKQSSGSHCSGFCTFAGGFCDWGNEQGDDFDWSLSRGSRNPVTGPAADRSPDKSGGGGYTFIDSSFPRRPGDVARLSSLIFPPTDANAPWCMRFWFHMFGPMVGALRVLIRVLNVKTPSQRQVWALSGGAGNAWFMAQVTVSSIYDFQVVLEASVGSTGMSDIAVDDVTFVQGPCPVAPQVAAPLTGDCTFEVDECGWISGQGAKERDRIEWQRVPVRTQNVRYQRRPLSSTQIGSNENEFYLNLGRKLLQPTGSTSQLISLQFQGSEEPRCLCFWYFMYEPFIDVGGPSLGVLRVLLQVGKFQNLLPIWHLTNNQGPTWNYGQVAIRQNDTYKVVFEGMWGPNRASGTISIDDISFYEGQCSIKPLHALVRPEDCSFEHGICGWHNVTHSDSNEHLMSWQVAFDMHHPAELPDRTFGTSEGYIFFDIFTTNQQKNVVRLLSPVMNGKGYDELCFTFWYAAFGSSDSTQLHVIKADPSSSTGQMMWNMTAGGYDSSRPSWTPAQFTVDARSSFTIILEGQASNGGFAVDDIKTLPGTCESERFRTFQRIVVPSSLRFKQSNTLDPRRIKALRSFKMFETACPTIQHHIPAD